jgi:general secretion pathway protein D
VVSINRRTARTEVMIRDQQTIVIGGLMRDAISNKEDKVPVLGDIPILGALFRKTNKKKRKTNLLLILTPYIIRDPGDLREIFERKMQERQQMIDRYFVFGEDKFEPHIDYSRTRGLVAEIVNEIDSVEAEIVLAKAAELAPAPDHVPRSPIGSYRAPETKAEETVVIGPNGVEPMEAEEPSSTEQVPPTAADEQEGGGAPPPPINLETPAEPQTPIESEENAVPTGPDEVIEPDEPESGPAEAAPAEEPGGIPAATEPEEPSTPGNQEGQDAPQ